MRIAIDLSALIARPTGVDRGLRGTVAALARLDDRNEYLLFVNREDRGLFGGAAPALPTNFRILPWSGRARAVRLAFQQVALPPLLAALGVDVLHSPTFIMPAWRGRRGHLLTVHDMTSFLVPDRHPASRRGRLYEAAVAGSIRRAGLVSVPSAAVKADIARLLPDVAAERVRVIPWGVDEAFRPRQRDEIDRTLDRLGVPRPYILYVGTLDPRKNLPALVEAYARWLAAAGGPEHLVLAGQYGWSVEALLARLGGTHLAGRVHLAGYVAEADLPALYAGARLFVYPSLLEGFGFPPLEAMAAGAPVVASRSSSLEENLAGAAELVAPEDVGQLAAAMQRLLADDGARSRSIAAGLRRAASFRWDACARSTLECYREISRAVGRA
jgi:alpha-1,3-rhamnosyl/mannosyltransferase